MFHGWRLLLNAISLCHRDHGVELGLWLGLRCFNELVLFVADVAQRGKQQLHGVSVQVVADVSHHVVRRLAVGDQELDVRLEGMHVACALAEQRLGGDVELVHLTALVTLDHHSNAALVAACFATCITRALDVLWAVCAVGVLLVCGGVFGFVTEVGPAVRQSSFFVRVELLAVVNAGDFRQCTHDDHVDLATDGVADLLTVDDAFECAVGVGLNTTRGCRRSQRPGEVRQFTIARGGDSVLLLEDCDVAHSEAPYLAVGLRTCTAYLRSF